jgi:repressor LexA
LKDHVYSAGSMPTLREICKEMGWKAVGSAQDVIQALIDKGFVTKSPHRARGLELKDQEDFRAIPILGSAPAGRPVEAIENHLGDIALPGFIRGPVFALRVQGDSMKDADIQNGDLVIVKQTEQAESGEIVVAVLNQEVTIKRLERKRDQLWLKPENDRYKAMLVEDPQFRILGKVIGLHRYWEKI